MILQKLIRSFEIAFAVAALIATAAPALAANLPPPANPQGTGWFGLFFDDGVGVIHLRPSGSTAETDYAPGIAASVGGNNGLIARLTVQPSNNINGDQTTACTPGAEGINTFSCDGPFTEWGYPYGGIDGNFDTGVAMKDGGSKQSIDIYLDTSFAANARGGGLVAATSGPGDYRFDWDSNLLNSSGGFLQDYVFNVGTGQSSDTCGGTGTPSGGFYVIEASNNSQRPGANAHNPTPPIPGSPHSQACVTTSGWYTFSHNFMRDKNGNLEVIFTLSATQGNKVINTWTEDTQIPFSTVGYNFLGWFPDQEINDLAVDNVQFHN